jgi:plasmid stabilization system protein ParE
MLLIEYHPGARRDFDESFDWYLARSVHTAVRFSAAIDATLEMMVARPERYALLDSVHRQCTVKRFPFRIVYRILSDRLFIVAIAHGKRKPGYWIDRD